MEPAAIERLLKKYLDAETSVQEENQLREYFESGNVAPHLQEYAPLFGYYSLSREEHYTGSSTNFKTERKKVYSWAAIAASIAIMAGIFFQEQPQEITGLGSYENPELALEKTKATLQMVSQLMNSGNEDLLYIKEFNNTKNSFLK